MATLHLIFDRLDSKAFETALGEWIQRVLRGTREPISINGEGAPPIRGQKVPGLHLVSAYTQRAGIEIALRDGRLQVAVGPR